MSVISVPTIDYLEKEHVRLMEERIAYVDQLQKIKARIIELQFRPSSSGLYNQKRLLIAKISEIDLSITKIKIEIRKLSDKNFVDPEKKEKDCSTETTEKPSDTMSDASVIISVIRKYEDYAKDKSRIAAYRKASQEIVLDLQRIASVLGISLVKRS